MIRQTLICTGLMLVIYSIGIVVFQGQIKRTGQTVEQRNIVKAEDFLYEQSQQADTLIVGSSMSTRLLVDSLPGHYYNLAFEGLSSVDGLRLIARTNLIPRLLLIEINTLDREPDTMFIAKLEKPFLGSIRAFFPFTRVKYQPVGVFKSIVRDAYVPAPVTEAIDTALITKIIGERLTLMNAISSQQDRNLMRAVATVSAYTETLRGKGTRVIFFEVPMDSRVRRTAICRRIRELVRLKFPVANYECINFPSDTYQTTDGIHLPRTESLRYTSYLGQQLTNGSTHPNFTLRYVP